MEPVPGYGRGQRVRPVELHVDGQDFLVQLHGPGGYRPIGPGPHPTVDAGRPRGFADAHSHGDGREFVPTGVGWDLALEALAILLGDEVGRQPSLDETLVGEDRREEWN